MIAHKTQQILNEVASRFGSRLLNDVQRVLEKYSRSGKLLSSVELRIIKATDKQPPRIVITYDDHGFFIGHRQMQWTKLPDMEKLGEWGNAINFSGPVPGYKNGLAPNLPPWKVKQRILWAIAKSKQKFDTHKPKRWKKEAKIGDIIKALNSDTVAAFSGEVERILTDALEGRS